MTDGVRHILVLANETVVGKSRIDAVVRRAAEGPLRVTVISPQNAPRAGYVVYEDERCATRWASTSRTR